MPYSVWSKPKVRGKDFSPHKNPLDAAKDSYRRQIVERSRFTAGAEGDGAIQHFKYRRPVGINKHLVQHPTDPTQTVELPSTATTAAFVPNQYVVIATDRTGSVIIGNPAPGNKGASGHTGEGAVAENTEPEITSVDPATIPQGSTIDLDVVGIQFEDGDVFDAAIYNIDTFLWEVDPLLTVNSAVFVDSENYTLNVTADATAPIGYKYNLRVERG